MWRTKSGSVRDPDGAGRAEEWLWLLLALERAGGAAEEEGGAGREETEEAGAEAAEGEADADERGGAGGARD